MVSVPDVTAMGLLVYQMTQMRQRADQLIQQERDRLQALEATAAVSKAAQDAAAVVAASDDDMEEGADEQERAESETDDDENESDSD
jgi:hypothetical protein